MKPPVHPPARARLLVVEDSSVFREMQALLLRQAGFGVWSFEDPAVALREAETQTFELALVDYELPGMNGAQFMQALRSLQPEVPVVIVSGTLTVELVAELTRQGAAGIFRKPTNPRTLLEKIHETLNRPGVSGELRAGTNLHGVSNVPFPVPEPARERLAYVPHYFYGASDTFRDFTHRLWRVRDFRSLLLLQGPSGSPFELVARELIDVSIFRAGPVMICEAGEFEPMRLNEILLPSLHSANGGTLVVHGVEDFSPVQQLLLGDLIALRGNFQSFTRRFRVVLTATPRLAERARSHTFDEALYYRISSLLLAIPSLGEIRADIAVNAIRLLEHYQSTGNPRAPVALTADAVGWLETAIWPRNYAQLAHTLYFALRYATGPELDVNALEAGAQDECADQLARASGHPLLSTASIDFAPQARGLPSAAEAGDDTPHAASHTA